MIHGSMPNGDMSQHITEGGTTLYDQYIYKYIYVYIYICIYDHPEAGSNSDFPSDVRFIEHGCLFLLILSTTR